MKTVVVLVLSLFAASAASGIYKCVVDGKTTFSQRPCGDSAEAVTVRSTPVAPSGSGAGHDPNYADKVIIDRRIRAKEQEIARYRRQMKSELAVLRQKKARAMNNLAGATWEQSISTEMQAAAAKYQAMIDVAQGELAQLRAERAALDSADNQVKDYLDSMRQMVEGQLNGGAGQ